MASQVTVTDLAKATGLSVATVSRALNKSGQVSPAARKKVLEAASKFNYVANPRFRAMGQTSSSSTRRTGNIGLLLPETKLSTFVTDPFYARLFWSIESGAKANGFHVTVATMHAENDNVFLPRFVGDLGVDGVLVSSGVAARDNGLLRRISALLPVVLVNDVCSDFPVSSVMPDENATILKSLSYLHGLGHSKIRYFDIHDGWSRHHRMRADAFRLHSMDRPSETSVILTKREKPLNETIVDVLSSWVASDDMPTAILCGADIYALAFLEAAEQLNISVPAQLSVMGIDNTVFGERSRPPLTSISQPLEQMGHAAIEMLKRKIESDLNDSIASTQVFDVTLIERKSCASPSSSN